MEVLFLVQTCLCLKPSVLSVQIGDVVVSLVLFCSSDATFFLFLFFSLFRPVRASELQNTKINSFRPQVLIQTVKIVKCICLLGVHQCILVHDAFRIDLMLHIKAGILKRFSIITATSLSLCV